MEKLVEQITPRDTDFAKWYTEVVTKSKLVSYSPVRGCVYYHPYGAQLWENVKTALDAMIKKTGHKNVLLPMLIPENMFMREKAHIEGFAPEVAWVTHFGEEKLTERLLLRPTSEVLFCDYFKNEVQSYRDLPQLINQWANIFRCEKTTRPFLRTSEFFWQEGHTLHETRELAVEETMKMLEVYRDLAENYLAIPVISGQKTEREKFAGGVSTFCIEAMMYNGYALQAGTSHYLGENFTKAFDIKYLGRDGKLHHPHQTSWGVSTRMLGAIVMTHGDDEGLVLPPKVAPIQAIIIPIAQHKEGVLQAAQDLCEKISNTVRAEVDTTDNTAGWKFAEYEMKGVPLRIEIGPKDIESKSCVVVRRDTREKITVALDKLETELPALLQKIHDNMYARALKRRESMTYTAETYEELLNTVQTKQGFVKAPWCGADECEGNLREKAGVTSRCFAPESPKGHKCVCCGKPAKQIVYWGKAY